MERGQGLEESHHSKRYEHQVSITCFSDPPPTHTNTHYVLTAHSQSSTSLHIYTHYTLGKCSTEAARNSAEPAFCGCHIVVSATLLSPSLSPCHLFFNTSDLISYSSPRFTISFSSPPPSISSHNFLCPFISLLCFLVPLTFLSSFPCGVRAEL